MENEEKLPFLDILVCKSCDKLITKVYRKPTSTGQYLNYNSNHASNVKLALAQGMFLRAIRHTSNESDKQAEIDTVKSELRSNGYPAHVLNNALKKLDRVWNVHHVL